MVSVAIGGMNLCHFWSFLLIRRVGLALLLLALLIPNCFAAEVKSAAAQRAELAASFEAYDFEPRGNRMDSRDRDHDSIPDYWQPLAGPEYSSYEAEKIRLVYDSLRDGYYPNAPGTVLFIPYSGLQIGAQTIYPKTVDPQMAYEITAFVKTRGLNGSIISINVIWLRVNENGDEQVVGDYDRLVVPNGQEDWTEAPIRRRINDLPPQANRVRLVCRVEDDPSIPGADRHGEAWFDDIKVEARPKIGIESEFRDDDQPLAVAISYQGLTANADEAEDLFGQKKKRKKIYSRRVEIRDANGTMISWEGRSIHTRRLNPGRSTTMTEELKPRTESGLRSSLDRRGIYYVHVRLYGNQQQPLATVTQVIGRWAPPRIKSKLKQDPQMLDQFGIGFDPLAIQGKTKYDTVVDILKHAGVFRAKVEMWPSEQDQRDRSETFLGIPPMLRTLRNTGIRFTGVFGRMPAILSPEDGMLVAMNKRQERLWQTMEEPIMQLGTQIDDWQWGNNRDTSFNIEFDGELLQPMRKRLREMTSAFIQAIPIALDSTEKITPESASEAVNIHVPATMDDRHMLKRLLPLVPEKFATIVDWQREIYPTEDLRVQAEVAAQVIANAPRRNDEDVIRPIWMSLEPMSVDPYLRQQRPERQQSIDLARKIIIARVLGIERVYAGSLLHPQQGLAAVRRSGRIVPRPALLALQTLATHMSGTEYLGSFQLGESIENYVFRKPGPSGIDTALIAMWYNGGKRASEIELGHGLGDLTRIDMAGNVDKVEGAVIKLSQVPILVDGMSVPLARTRMSIRIMPSPPLMSRIEKQEQQLRIRNFFEEPLTGTLHLVYAVDENYSLEPGWVSPPDMRVNLPPGGVAAGKRVEIRRVFDVRPTLEAVLGRKFIQIETQLAAARESHFNIHRATNLVTDLKMEPAPRIIPTPNSNEKVVRLSIAWKPDPREAHPLRLDIRPYFQILGDQPNALSRMTVYPNQAAAIRDIRIPFLTEGMRVWIGATEESGSRFVRFEVTNLIRPELKQ